MHLVLLRLNKLGIAYFIHKNYTYVQISHKLVIKEENKKKPSISIRHYFRRCTSDGIIRGPFLLGYDLSNRSSPIRQINIFSKNRTLEAEDSGESITLSTQLKVSIMLSYIKFLETPKAMQIEKMQSYLKEVKSMVSGNRLYIAVAITTNEWFRIITREAWYCEATLEPHGLVINIPRIFNHRNFIFISNKGYVRQKLVCKAIRDTQLTKWFDIISSLERSVNGDLIPEIRLDPLFYCFVLRKWNNKLALIPRPIIRKIILYIYPLYETSYRVTNYLLTFNFLRPLIPRPIVNKIYKKSHWSCR